MSLRHRHRLAWYLCVIALMGKLLAPVVQAATQAHLSESPRPATANVGTLSRVDVRERLRHLMHMSVAEIRAVVTEHNGGSKRLCQLTSSLANATANALPAGFVATPILLLVVPLPHAHGVPVEGHVIEGLHPLSTGPPV